MAEQEVRYCTAPDGGRLAYTVSGDGPGLVMCPTLIEQFSLIHQLPSWQAFLDRLAAGRRLLLYDQRGVGLSERKATDFSMESRLHDLEAVIQASRLRRFAMFADMLGGRLAVVYAARHPRHVSHLILYGTFIRGADVMPWDRLRVLLDLARSDWPTAAQVLADMSTRAEHPEAGIAIAAHFRESTSGENFAAGLTQGYDEDVSDLLPLVKAPALVLHRRDDAVVPFAAAQGLAAGLPNARLVPLDGNVHAPFLGDAGAVLNAIDGFLGRDAATPPRPAAATPAAAPAVQTILFTDIAGSTALSRRLGDAQAQEIRRAHNTIVREALRQHDGAEIKHTGDGIMAAFAAASAAIDCAVAVQRAVHDHNQGEERGGRDLRPMTRDPLLVHIGVNAGEPIAEEDDLFGTSVDLARRICDHAEAGQVLVSNVVRELAAGKGFLFSDVGDVLPKGFDEAVRLYEVRWREET